MIARATEFASLSREERTLLCTVTAVLLSSRLLLPVVGLDRTRRTIGWLVRALPPYARLRDPDHVPWAVEVAVAHLPVTLTCLMRAIAGEALLTASDYRARIRLGVARDEEFRAHAWVERQGEVVIGDLEDLACYQPLSGWEAKWSAGRG